MKSRTIQIIEKHGRILLKSKDGWYVSGVSNLAAGPDCIVWGKRPGALEMFNLKWAHMFAYLLGCKVVVVYPKRKTRHLVGEPGYQGKGNVCYPTGSWDPCRCNKCWDLP